MTKLYFACHNPNCPNVDRPFGLTPEQLQAGGVLWCKYCDQICVPVQPTDQALAAAGAEPLLGLKSFFQTTPPNAG
jgi:hypothetical protein